MENPETKTPQDQEAPDRSSLADLYPQAKTMEQRIADRDAIEARKGARLPQRIVRSTILRLYSVLVILFLAIHVAPLLFSVGGVVGGVPWSFGLALIFMAYTYTVYSRIAKDFTALGCKSAPFLGLYTFLFPAIGYLISLIFAPADSRIGFAVAVTISHFLFAYVLMKLVGARS